MKIYIYGSHVKCGFYQDFVSFADIDNMNWQHKGWNIYNLLHSKKQPFWKFDGEILDGNNIGEPRKLECFAEYRRGKKANNLKVHESMFEMFGEEFKCFIEDKISALNSSRFDRIVLMNDEIMWQFRTGSVLYYRFDNIKSAKEYYIHLLRSVGIDPEIKYCKKTTKFSIGDIVRLNKDVNEFYKTGDIVRIYNCNEHAFVITPTDGITLIRVPNTGGSKNWLGYEWVPINYADLIFSKSI